VCVIRYPDAKDAGIMAHKTSVITRPEVSQRKTISIVKPSNETKGCEGNVCTVDWKPRLEDKNGQDTKSEQTQN
jgi:hypothetical protein